MSKKTTLRLAALAILPLGFLVLSSGLTAQGANDPVFSEVIEVNLVNVSVTVTDKDGNPIKGLTQEDFEILEDGRPIEIANFYAVDGGKPPSRYVQTEDPPPAWTPLDEIATPDPLENLRYVVLFIDNSTLQKQNRKKLFRSLRDFVADQVGPLDRVAVAGFDDKNGYKLLQDFTNSAGDIVMAIDKLEKSPAGGNHIKSSRQVLVRDLETADLAPGRTGTEAFDFNMSQVRMRGQSMLNQVEQLAFQEYHRARSSINAIAYVASSLAGLPGRKAMLYVSEGLPMRPGETLYHAHFNRFGVAAENYDMDKSYERPETAALKWDLSQIFQEMVTLAQSNDVTFYAIDAAGQRSGFSSGVDRRLRDPNSLAAASYTNAWEPRLDALRDNNLQAPLRLTSSRTGGALLANNRRYDDFLDRLEKDLENYYSLGYQAPHPKGGQHHKIEVRLRDKARAKELKVRYPEAYRDKTWNQRLTDVVVTKLLHDIGDNSMDVRIMPGEKSSQEGKYVVPVQIGVPLGRMTLVPTAGEEAGQVAVVLLVKDSDGNTSPPRIIPLRVKLPEGTSKESPGRLAVAEVNLLMEGGEQTIGVGVRDEIAGTMSAARMTLELPRVKG